MPGIHIEWWLPTVIGIVSLFAGYIAHGILAKARLNDAKHAVDMLKEKSLREVDSIVKDSKIQARDEVIKARNEFEAEVRSRRTELKESDERTTKRESTLDRKVAMLEKKETMLDQKTMDLDERQKGLSIKETKLASMEEEEHRKLQEIAHMSDEQARESLMARLEDELKHEAGTMIRHVQEEAKATAETKARKIITQAIERYASNQVNEITTSTVALPNDEMKGRIIGKEGRNIRSLESLTGVNILIDDTPEVVVLSGFDPMRREIARITLERLITDGRIHPARIEEVVKAVEEETEETIRKAAEAAIYELGIKGVDPDVMRTLGRLKYRHSYSQNILKHSVEVGHLMGMMASELGLDPDVAKRAGLFHDIGKALTHEIEGGHALIGADLLKKHGEDPVVINAVASHHYDVEPESLYATLVTAADAMTASRPGARSETTDLYIKRLEKLEEIATSFRGVEKCFAMQAGREIRVIVEPSKIADEDALQMARNISKQIEQQLEYPGQIKVTVVRETRCVEYAR